MELENPVFMDISVMEKEVFTSSFCLFDSKEVNIFPEIAAGGRLEGMADIGTAAMEGSSADVLNGYLPVKIFSIKEGYG